MQNYVSLVEMPTFAIYWTDEQRAEAQKVIDDMNRRILDGTFESKGLEDEPVIDDKKLWKELRRAGYTVEQTEEIIARVYCGQTLDSAMQSV